MDMHHEHEQPSEASHHHPMEHDGKNHEQPSVEKHGGHHEHGAHVNHSGHEQMFRRRFWVSLVLTIPVLLFSPMIQEWFGFQMPQFPGSQFVGPAFAIAIFIYGGLPFLQMAVPEVQNRQPGMMTLISLAITTAFAYSLFAVFVLPRSGFFWEMATLIDIMLLGHWFEMRSVRQASGALNELAKLMPDTAEKIMDIGEIEVISADELKKDDLVLVRPGTSIPADGVVEDGHSDVNEVHDNRGINAGIESTEGEGGGWDDQWGWKFARAGHGYGGRNCAGRDYAAGRAGAGQQIQHTNSGR